MLLLPNSQIPQPEHFMLSPQHIKTGGHFSKSFTCKIQNKTTTFTAKFVIYIRFKAGKPVVTRGSYRVCFKLPEFSFVPDEFYFWDVGEAELYVSEQEFGKIQSVDYRAMPPYFLKVVSKARSIGEEVIKDTKKRKNQFARAILKSFPEPINHGIGGYEFEHGPTVSSTIHSEGKYEDTTIFYSADVVFFNIPRYEAIDIDAPSVSFRINKVDYRFFSCSQCTGIYHLVCFPWPGYSKAKSLNFPVEAFNNFFTHPELPRDTNIVTNVALGFLQRCNSKIAEQQFLLVELAKDNTLDLINS